MAYVRDEGGVRLRALGITVALVLLVLCLFELYPGLQRLIGLAPERVLVVHLREENSSGLLSLPSPEAESAAAFSLDADGLILPAGAKPVPGGTRLIVIRELFAAGARLESRVIYLSGLPAVIEARAGAAGAVPIDPDAALLAVDVVLDQRGGDRSLAVVTAHVPGMFSESGEAVVSGAIEPGADWRVAAVREADHIRILRPDEPAYEDSVHSAFHEGRPVSLLCLTNLGFITLDRIEHGVGSGG